MSQWGLFAEKKKKKKLSPYDAAIERMAQLPAPTLALSAFTVGAISAWGTAFVYKRYFRRIPNADWITPDVFKRRRWIKGRVVSVGDADNFRVYHMPGFGWRWPFKLRGVPTTQKALKDNTIHIRMAGVDAPEGGHFGKPTQENYAVSLDWLKRQVAGRMVYCMLYRRDQYSRVVAMPYLKPWFLPGFMAKGKCIPIEMLRAGWAVTYKQSGAEYGPYSEAEFDAYAEEARKNKRGIWKGGGPKETPAEYKKRYASGATLENDETVPDDTPKIGATGTKPKKRRRRLRELSSKLLGR